MHTFLFEVHPWRPTFCGITYSLRAMTQAKPSWSLKPKGEEK